MTKPATTPGRKRSKALQGSMATALLLLAISRVTYAQPPDSARAAPIKPTERQRVVSLVYQLTGAGSYTCSGTSGMKDFEAVRARFEVERTELVSLMTKSPEYAEVKKAVDESHEHVRRSMSQSARNESCKSLTGLTRQLLDQPSGQSQLSRYTAILSR